LIKCSAGSDEHEPNHWPELLARSHQLELSNYARPGANVSVALRHANEASLGDGLVLLEIGGNDVLGSTGSAVFVRDLEKLLGRACHPGRHVVMFELPLPPLYNEFGRLQRRLAAHYGVLLIRKRVLVGVIAREEPPSLHSSNRTGTSANG
jgi:acyl-CoA thioesterase I